MYKKPYLVEVEGSGSAQELNGIAEALVGGQVVIVRRVDALLRFRQELIRYASQMATDAPVEQELVAYMDDGVDPSLETVWALSKAVHLTRRCHYLPMLLAPLIAAMGFSLPVRVHHGIPRVVFRPQMVEEARASGRFPPEDFQRTSASGYTEFFMPGAANIHRDYNRPHGNLMCNMWLTLYDTPVDGQIRIWPQHFRSSYLNMENTADNAAKLGPPLDIATELGDLVLFHSEQLHTSPLNGNNRRRFSYDLRILSDCHNNDGTNYRHDFLDLRNFPIAADVARDLPGLSALEALVDAHDGIPNGVQGYSPVLDWPLLEREAPLEADVLKQINARFRNAGFTEDRFFLLARRALHSDRELALALLNDCLEASQSPFWLVRCADMLEAIGENATARRGFEKVLTVADGRTVPNYSPVHYPFTTWNEALPPDLADHARARLEVLASMPASDATAQLH